MMLLHKMIFTKIPWDNDSTTFPEDGFQDAMAKAAR